MAKKSAGGPTGWELEQAFDMDVTLDDLIKAQPFRQASDERGHSETVGTRVPMWFLRRINKLRELKGSPYEVNSDVVRDALYKGLIILHLQYRYAADWDVETKLAAVVDATGAGKRIRMQVEELVSGLEDFMKDEDVNHACSKLEDYVSAVSQLEDEWHQTRVLRLLRANTTIRHLADTCREDVKDLLLKKEK